VNEVGIRRTFFGSSFAFVISPTFCVRLMETLLWYHSESKKTERENEANSVQVLDIALQLQQCRLSNNREPEYGCTCMQYSSLWTHITHIQYSGR
jgi:hypothetical protein